MREALQEARAYRDPLQEDKGFSSKQIKQAYGVLNDPRYKQGNYDGAYRAIQKIAYGLADHPDVKKAMKRANEETITEFKSMTVTIPDPMKRAKAIKDIERFGKGTGFKIDVMGDKFKVDGKGADLNKFATDLKNFYGATVKAEELDEALEVKWDSNKQGWFDKQGRRRYLGKMATNKLMSKAIDKAKETGDFINPFKLKHGQKPEQKEEAGEKNEETV
jgi:hypothetical protein|tara:strand:- start:20 stop:676 length:657 start_codon:yes stop_codon:yes gene_type:complete